MSRHDARIPLYEIVAACDEIAGLIQGLSAEFFAERRILQLAVERLLITCGEAVSRLLRYAPELTESWTTSPRQVVGLRNFITHEYDRVDVFMVFGIAQGAATGLRKDASTTLALLGSNGN